jgi:hypothetical protein
MKKSDAFPCRWFKAEDVKSKPIVVTIDKLYQGPVGSDKEEKNILSFTDTEKELICNATNWDSVAEITGETDSDDWHGHKIVLVHERVDFGGKKVDAVRIISTDELEFRQSKQRVKLVKTATAKADPELDDEIPFA